MTKAKAKAKDHAYGEVDTKSDLTKIFTEIRQQVESANSREDLTELHKRAGYLITLTYAPSWVKKFGEQAEELRKSAAAEFTKTTERINNRATKIGTQADYDVKWGKAGKS